MGRKRSRPIRYAQRLWNTATEDVKLALGYIAVFIAAVFGCACVYWALTPGRHGLFVGGDPLGGNIFLNAAYFSVATVTSLGYGDIRPGGWSKAIAGFEVVVGLLLFGMTVAKLTSSRLLSHHVRILYRTELQKRLEEFAGKLEADNANLVDATHELMNVLQSVPGRGRVNESRKRGAISRVREHMIRVSSNWLSFQEYICDEGSKGDLLQIAPKGTLLRACDALDSGIYSFAQFVIGLAPLDRPAVFDGDMRRRISKSRETIIGLCDFVDMGATDAELQERFQEIRVSAVGIPENSFSVPQSVADNERPDLRMGEANPQIGE